MNKNKLYFVRLAITGYIEDEVVAESKEDAIDIALDRDYERYDITWDMSGWAKAHAELIWGQEEDED